MTDQEIQQFAIALTKVKGFLAAWGAVAPDLREAMQPALNQLAVAQTEARIEAMLHARGRGISDADCLKLAQEVSFFPI